ncbi:glycosyltransferase family 4 protein [Desulfofustis glycolicus]|uniref:Glycosyltransferase involved in cell wall bisynthesis n=1 Tax=Desulfofustis glycolicus DSM 9705 TaxID=1121409 RepID=A0A1M5VQ39_9BACT|nr:glycosyltransferase family 4 protein [Desulfofustis glycolicus]SHH77104.1 Glycosyltransferase involved in cell wall bisynthesis [Desulfofustis glycolicus DSM 9705]
MSGSQLKILILGPLPPEANGHNFGGVARHVWGLSCALHAKGHAVNVLPMGRYFFPSHQVRSGFFCYRGMIWPGDIPIAAAIVGHFLKGGCNGFEAKDFLHALNASFRVAVVADMLPKYDIIHVHGVYNGALQALSAINVHPPIITTIHSYHDVFFRKRGQKKRVRIINKRLKWTDGIIHVSKADRAKGGGLGVSLPDREFVVPNGLPEPERPYTPWSGRNGFCFVGSLQARKRIELVLKARRNCGSPGPLLRVAGSGAHEYMVKKAKESGEPVQWKGFVQNVQAREIMRQSCVLVGPSLSESFGLIYIEALMEGAAVIGYEPIIREFHEYLKFDEDEKRLLVPFSATCEDSKELASFMMDTFLWRCSEEGEETMKRLRKRVIAEFGWHGVADKVISVYQKTISCIK